MTPQYTRGTARTIAALGWVFASMALTAAIVCSVFFGLHLIGGYLVLGVVTLTLLNLALRVDDGARWFVLATAAVGGTCAVIANTGAAGSTVGNGLFHWLSVIVWGVGFLAAFGASRSGGAR